MAFEEIPLQDLATNDYNPRRRIDEDRIAELAQSIERVGLISPLTVRRLDGDGEGEGDGDQGLTDIDDQIKAKITGDGPTYEVVAGTRRLHALRQIHGETSDHPVPCQVVEIPDAEAELLALAENIDRDDLTPTEEAEAFAKRLFVTTDKATAETLQADAGAEVRMAGNNHTVAFHALVQGLRSNVTPAGVPLPMPSRKGRSVREVADDIPSRTPQEIARRCRLYALPEKVWPLVDDGELPLRQAEIIAGLAGVEAPWRERVEEMIETARECAEETWDKVTCREECGERKGRMAGDGEPSLHSRVAEAREDVEGEVDEVRERVEELRELAERLERGLEERVSGELVGLDARKKYCSSCGQAVTKGEIEEVLERVRGELVR